MSHAARRGRRRKTHIEPEDDALLVCGAAVLDEDEEEVGRDCVWGGGGAGLGREMAGIYGEGVVWVLPDAGEGGHEEGGGCGGGEGTWTEGEGEQGQHGVLVAVSSVFIPYPPPPLKIAPMRLLPLLALAPLVAAEYFSAGWQPGQPAHPTQAPPAPTYTPSPPSSKGLSDLFSLNTLLTLPPVAGLFDRFGINITERVALSRADLWDERIPFITDHNYNDLIVNEALTEEEQASRVWLLVVYVPCTPLCTRLITLYPALSPPPNRKAFPNISTKSSIPPTTRPSKKTTFPTSVGVESTIST
jgi:hypothetical protein